MRSCKKKIAVVIFSLILLFYGGWILLVPHTHYGHSIELIEAIKEEDISKIEEILQNNPNCVNSYPSIMNSFGQSAMDLYIKYPLNEACAQGDFTIIKMLVEAGADINCNDGYTPLSLTYRYKKDNWYMISCYLLENGADLNYKTRSSGDDGAILEDIVAQKPGGSSDTYIPENQKEVYVAFLYAVEHCDESQINWARVFCDCISVGYERRSEIINYLLDNGYCMVNDAPVNMTPLMFAAMNGDVETVEFLLSKGADKNIKDDEGKTALDYAVEYQKGDIISLLKE